MKKLILFLFLILSVNCFAQSDTTAFPTTPGSWYLRLNPITMNVGSPGTLNNRTGGNLEFGRTLGMVDLGLSTGLLPRARSIGGGSPDSSRQFLEAKVSMDGSQYGIFSNEFTFGAGTILHSNTPYLFEASTTMFAQLDKWFGFGIVVGDYYMTGDKSSGNIYFFGAYARYGLLRTMDGGLHRGHGHHHHGR